jgi:hypothetical protein
MSACYQCGGYPNHPNPSLDVLRLIQCADCGTIACVKHRKGITGGQCPKCGSSRDFIIAIRTGKSDKKKSMKSFGGGGGSTAAAASAVGAISKAQLSQMKDNRSKAESDGKKRLAAMAAKALTALKDSKQKKIDKDKEDAVQALMGSKNLLMGETASIEKPTEDSSSAPKTDSVGVESNKTVKSEENKDSKNKKKPILSGQFGTAVDHYTVKQADKEKKIVTTEATDLLGSGTDFERNVNKKSGQRTINFQNSLKSASLEYAEDVKQSKLANSSSLAGVQANSKTANSSIAANGKGNAKEEGKTAGKDKSDKTDKSKDNTAPDDDKKSFDRKSTSSTITLRDNFCVKANERLDLAKGVERKKAAEEELANFISSELNLSENIKCKVSVNCLIPIDYIDHLLNIDTKTLNDEKINLITGFLTKSYTNDNIFYLDQLEKILPSKSHITGIYGCFSGSANYSFTDQKELNLRLLDLAQESGKTFYLGLENADIKYWKEIFDEYDLSEINFVYTEVINNDEVLEFIKQNNIKILIRPDVDFQYYYEIIQDYDNFCMGSSFEKLQEKHEDDNTGNSAILTKIIKNMHKIDKNCLDILLNC